MLNTVRGTGDTAACETKSFKEFRLQVVRPELQQDLVANVNETQKSTQQRAPLRAGGSDGHGGFPVKGLKEKQV